MPAESAGCADVWLVQRFLKEDVDGGVRAVHMPQHRELDALMQSADRLCCVCISGSGWDLFSLVHDWSAHFCVGEVFVDCSVANGNLNYY